jgi:CheY-like chemotaxis protein
MTFSVLVAEPGNDDWTSIAEGIKRQRPEAEILRVKDGEQAVRFLFYRGLLSEIPETPDLVVLAAHLDTVPVEAVVARVRQHPRTCMTPVIVVGHKAPGLQYAQWLELQHSLVAVSTDDLENEVAEALQRLADGPPLLGVEHRPGIIN